MDGFSQNYSKCWKDLNYTGDTMVYHMLDIYLPKIEKPSYPVVILIYGSGWLGNNLKESAFETLGEALLDSGFAVVTPNHRSSSDAKFPAQTHDIKAAIRFIRANAEQFQIDTSFIGISGFSSGGHLATLAGTSGGVKQYTVGATTFDLEGNIGQHTTYSSSVNAVVDWFGPTDFLVMDSCGSSMVHNAPNSPESSLIGGPIQDNKDKCALANPITYIDANDPPFLILHGDEDPLVPYCQSELLFDALQESNAPSQFILVPEGQHGPGLFEEEYFKMMSDFFLKVLSESGVGIRESDGPIKFSVTQDYPNPFNSTTIISFTLPVKSFVTLVIFDSLGREVSKLISKELLPGTYTRQWNAKGLSSGTYFSQLQIGSYIEAKKIILIK
jgi:acetyl esterase/lipase